MKKLTGFLYDLVYLLCPSIVTACVVLMIRTETADGASLLTTRFLIAFVICACITAIVKQFFARASFIICFVLCALDLSLLAFADRFRTIDAENVIGFVFNFCLCLLPIAFMALFEYLFSGKKIYRVIITSVVMLPVIILMFMHMHLDIFGTCALVFYVVTAAIEIIRQYKKDAVLENIKGYVVSFLPFVIILTLVAANCPKSQYSYDWHFVKVIWEQTINICEKLFPEWGAKRHEEKYAVIGFSDTADFSNSIIPESEKKLVLQVGTDRIIHTNIYLKGKTFDTFNGKEWTTSNKDDTDTDYIDALRMAYKTAQYDSDSSKFYKPLNISIVFEDIDTNYVFRPMKNVNVEVLGMNRKYDEHESFIKDGDVRFKNVQGKGTFYNLTGFQFNLKQPIFTHMLREERSFDAALFETVSLEFAKEYGRLIRYDDILKDEEKIRERYLSDVELTDRTKELLDEIFKEKAKQLKVKASSLSDIDKIYAIEEYLQGMEYNVLPGVIPDSAASAGGFIDYMLFEAKRGFCVHYATVMTLLSRSIGVPSRYIQGYCTFAEGTYLSNVYDKDAHAWCEVFIDGFGWIQLEATPGHSTYLYTPWLANDLHEERAPETGWDDEEEELEIEEITGDLPIIEKKNGLSGKNVGIIIGACIGAIIILIPIAIVIKVITDHDRRRKRYDEMARNSKFLIVSRQNFRILAALGLKRNEGETLMEYRTRLTNENLKYGKHEVLEVPVEFIGMYNGLFYGDRDVSKAEFFSALSEEEKLMLALKQKKPFEYLYNSIKLYISDYR